MKRRLILSPATKRDFDGILSSIAQDKPGAALRFVKRLRSRCEMLTKHPLIGEDCGLIRSGMRRITYAGYLIFFLVDEEQVEIVRIIHGARDWSDLFD